MQPIKPSFLDRFVNAVSPQAGLQRVIARQKLFRYEAAQSTRARQTTTNRPLSPETSQYQSDRVKIMFQARDLLENEPLVRSILLKISNYTLGRIRYQAMTGNEAWDQTGEDYFNEWCTRCDITGRHSFGVISQILLMGGYRDGDGGFVLVDDPSSGELRLQSIEADRLGNPYDLTVSPDYIGGISINPSTGQPISYRIFNRDAQSSAYTNPIEVPANSFIHFFDPMRADQYRGISSFASSLNTIRDIHEIIECEKLSVKLGSSITGVVKSEMGDPLSSSFFNDTVNDPSTSSRTNSIETMEPGQWRYLLPGEDVKMFENDRPSPAFQGFLQMLVRYVALSVNLPYGFVYDLTGLNGPSVRQDSAQAEREFQRIQTIFTEKVLNPIKTRVIARAIENGDLKPNPKFNRGKWQFPAHVTIDVGRESAAAVAEVGAGMQTLADWYGMQGKDVNEELEQSAKEARMINDLAEKYDVDPSEIRMMTPNGNPATNAVKQEEPAKFEVKNQAEELPKYEKPPSIAEMTKEIGVELSKNFIPKTLEFEQKDFDFSVYNDMKAASREIVRSLTK